MISFKKMLLFVKFYTISSHTNLGKHTSKLVVHITKKLTRMNNLLLSLRGIFKLKKLEKNTRVILPGGFEILFFRSRTKINKLYAAPTTGKEDISPLANKICSKVFSSEPPGF